MPSKALVVVLWLAGALASIGSYRTNLDCDVNRSGKATALDFAYVRADILNGTAVGVDQSWACDVSGAGDAKVNVLDLNAVRATTLNP